MSAEVPSWVQEFCDEASSLTVQGVCVTVGLAGSFPESPRFGELLRHVLRYVGDPEAVAYVRGCVLALERGAKLPAGAAFLEEVSDPGGDTAYNLLGAIRAYQDDPDVSPGKQLREILYQIPVNPHECVLGGGHGPLVSSALCAIQLLTGLLDASTEQ